MSATTKTVAVDREAVDNLVRGINVLGEIERMRDEDSSLIYHFDSLVEDFEDAAYGPGGRRALLDDEQADRERAAVKSSARSLWHDTIVRDAIERGA